MYNKTKKLIQIEIKNAPTVSVGNNSEYSFMFYLMTSSVAHKRQSAIAG
jgi:hypothetical protein